MEIDGGMGKGDLLKRLGQIIMKAEKSHTLQSASQRPRETSSVIQSKSKGLRTGEPML